MSDDAKAVRDYLDELRDWSWARPDDESYVAEVVAEMEAIRAAHPAGEYPLAIHDLDEVGACSVCDARRVLGFLVTFGAGEGSQ